MLNCPRDKESLSFVENASGTFSYCKKCGGIWIAGKDLLDSISIDTEDYLDILLKKGIKIDKKPEVQMTCSCDTKLVTMKIQKTYIDICPNCKGTRFDYQELGKIKTSIKNEKPSVMKIIKEFASIDAIAYEKKMIKFNIIECLIKGLLK